MPKRAEWTIKPFTNPSGKTVWRLSGRLEGQRIRENFPTAAEADTKRLDYIARAGGSQSTHTHVVTWLTEERVREAEAAVQILGSRSLIAAAQLYAKHDPVTARDRALQPLINAFLREKAGKKKHTRENLERRLSHFVKITKAKTLAEVTFRRVRDWVFEPGKMPNTQRSRRSVISQFVNWLASKPRQLLPKDFLEGLPEVQGDSEDARRLFVPEVQRLMTAAQIEQATLRKTGQTVRMLHNYVLRTFVGLRPSEVEEVAEAPGQINLDEGYVYANGRAVKLEPNARAWLIYCAEEAPEIVFHQHVHERVKKRAGLAKKWQPDICRHTYGSVHLRRFKDIKRTVEDMGNSEKIVRRYYAVPMTDEEREEFDNLLPPGWVWKKTGRGAKAGRVAVKAA